MTAYPGAPPDSNTMLVISVMGVPLYSARGLSQTLESIDASKNMRRTINGQLVNVAHPQFQKWKSKITCTDMRTPALDGMAAGMTVTVDCVATLAYPVGGSPSRTMVPGSSWTEGNFVFYRPRLTML